jgi:hypothetical protein
VPLPMRRSPFIILLLTLLAWVSPVHAQQQNTPRVGYVFPAGGRQGTTVQVTIGGQRLDGAFDVHISGTGVRATIGEITKPLTAAQTTTLRDQLKELQDKRAAALAPSTATRPATAPATATRPATTSRPATTTRPAAASRAASTPATAPRPVSAPASASQPGTRPTWTAADEKTLADIRQKLASVPRRQANPALAESVTLQVTIDANAAPGPRELRLFTPTGLSNPLVFCVGQLPEFTATPSSSVTLGANGMPTNPVVPATAPAPQPATPLTLPVVVNGQILPGSVDRIRFKAAKGTQVVVQTSARALMPYLSDAVPGWFQAAVAIEDDQGREIAFANHFRYDPDPLFCCVLPRDGDYLLTIRDTIYRGREDFVYRVALGEFPVITSIFPLGAKAGNQASVQLLGWNLPTDKYTLDTAGKPPGTLPISVVKNNVKSNTMAFVVDTFPETLERQPNDTAATAQSVTLPIMIDGRVDKPGSWHVFKFDAKAGDQVVAEVNARRLGSPLDSVLKLTDASGKLIAVSDDREDKASGLLTQDADSLVSATLPAKGTYYIYLGDAQQKGGPEYGFRLRLSAPRPDFELRVTPAELAIRAGTSVPLTVTAIRKDGFTGPIALNLAQAPAGFTLTGGGIPANQNEIKLTLKAPAAMLDEPATLRLEGQATIDGRPVVHTALAAEDMMQAFAYRHLVPQKEWLVAVPPQAIARNAIKILTPTPLKITGSATIPIRASLPPAAQQGKVLLELADPPEGITLASYSAQTISNVSLDIKCDGAKLKAGLKGNLIVNVFVERDPPAGAAPQAPKRRVPLGSMPAIPFEVDVGLP